MSTSVRDILSFINGRPFVFFEISIIPFKYR